MGLFNLRRHKEKSDIKKVIRNHYKVQEQIEKDLTNGEEKRAIAHIRESMQYLAIIKNGCATNGYGKLLPKIEGLIERYDKMIGEYHLEL